MFSCDDVKRNFLDSSPTVLRQEGGKVEQWEALGVGCLLQLLFLYSLQRRLLTGWSRRDRLVLQDDLRADQLIRIRFFHRSGRESVQGDDALQPTLHQEVTVRGWP